MSSTSDVRMVVCREYNRSPEEKGSKRTGENAGAPRGGHELPAELLRITAETHDSNAIQYAAELIRRGKVVGVPTDTFYGLAADPFNLAAVEEIYRVKGRPEDRALPILVCSLEQALTLTRELPDTFLKLAQKFWPGAL